MTLPVSHLYCHFLKFKWGGQLYMYIVLPFGLTSAPRLLNLMPHRPVKLTHQCQLFLPWDRNHQHPHPNLKLCSVMLSGTGCVLKDMTRTPPSKLLDHGTSVQRKDIPHTSPTGCSFVLTGKWTQCNHLSQ